MVVIKNELEEKFYGECSDDVVEVFEKTIEKELGFEIGTRDTFDKNQERFVSIMSLGSYYSDDNEIYGLEPVQILDFFRDALDNNKPTEFLKDVYGLEEEEYDNLVQNLPLRMRSSQRPETGNEIAEATNDYLEKDRLPMTDAAVAYLESKDEWAKLSEIDYFVIEFLELGDSYQTKIRDDLMRLKYEGLTKSKKGYRGLEFKLRESPKEDITYRTIRDGVSAEMK